jgi:uncharacterized protein YjbI with pentapeptide repeats
MANPEHFAILEQGVTAWNRWRQLNPTTVPRLDEIDLEVSGSTRIELGGVDFNTAILEKADLSMVILRAADLRHAHLRASTLVRADLREADLEEADLRQANLRGADLRGANLAGARLFETVFGDTNLRGTRGLEVCKHPGPSIVDHRTLAKSGPLPLAFLRGCGLPDRIIEYAPLFANQPTHFNSCFISYSNKDQEFAERLHADLQEKGVRCWFAPHDIRGGRKIQDQIYEAIHLYDRLLLILSEHSMNSEWVKTEIAHARQKELNERRQVLFPMSLVPFATIEEWKCFDAGAGKDSAREIREYFIPDFSNWRDKNYYERALQRLVIDLKAGGRSDSMHQTKTIEQN